MEANDKVLGLDGKLYQESDTTYAVPVKEKSTKKIETGMIMDGIEDNNEEKIEMGKTMDEAMPKLDEKTMQRLLAYQNRKPSVRENKKIGRNDPCPCGSGKKFKQCCMNTKDWNKLIKKQ